MEKCPKCDNEINPNNMECPHCGIVYEKYEKRKAKNKENHKRLKGILGLIYLGIFTLLSIAIINYIFPDKQSPQAPPPISPEGDILSSLEASINYLSQPKFAQMISSVKDKGGVYITVRDSFWYNLTTSQQKQFADRMLDIIYASGDVGKHVYIKDEHTRVVAEQHTEKMPVGIGLIPYPYMDLK